MSIMVLDDIRGIYLQAAERIEALRPGERLPATALAEDLAKDLGMTGPQLYPIVKRLLDGYPGTTLKRGARSGICKNAPARIGGPIPVSTTPPVQIGTSVRTHACRRQAGFAEI